MKNRWLLFPFLLGLCLTQCSQPTTSVTQRPEDSSAAQSTPTPQAEKLSQVKNAIEQAISAQKTLQPIYSMSRTEISNLRLSPDGSWSFAWLNPLDPDTGQVVPAEPGLAVVQLREGIWQATLPNDPAWESQLKSLPSDLMPDDIKQQWLEMAISEAAPAAGPFGGYYLPWEGGTTMYLTQSVGHDRYTPSGSAHFSFDFAKPGYPSGMFEVYAAKAGTVTRAVWSHANGNENYGNYLVLEDTTTVPTTYQLYLHLAQNSIPAELRVAGAKVVRGQVLGVADDTGVSSGNHLHFMVHTNPSSYWGTSVDITFDDVSINGGRPREINDDPPYCRSSDVCNSYSNTYVSGNVMSGDHTPPQGGILQPTLGQVVSTASVHIEGWGNDADSGLGSAQILARYNGTWNTLNPAYTTSPFSVDWDLCAAEVPDGPVSLALKLSDKEGNQTTGLYGLTHFIKTYTCPTTTPTTCSPSENQVALFSEPDYSGKCSLLGIGSYANGAALGSVGGNQAASIKVGGNVQATLYLNDNKRGRGETFIANDSNLSDNLVGKDTVSSAWVQSRTSLPSTSLPVWPSNKASFSYDGSIGASLSLAWENGGGALEYQVHLNQSEKTITSPWLSEPTWHLGSLSAGSYSWQVQARNSAGVSPWSSTYSFTMIGTDQASQPVYTAPYGDTMESGGNDWNHTANWNISTHDNHTEGGTTSWHYVVSGKDTYDSGLPNTGDLTSPPIQIPADSDYYLRFWYAAHTETAGPHWDQRWLQLSVDNGPFTNALLLTNDPSNFWLQSPVISLGTYKGHTIQLRFHFETLDKELNAYKGWWIDDVRINTDPPPTCRSGDQDNSPAQAGWILPGLEIQATICPGEDLDYYKFNATAGDQIAVRTLAQSIGSPLDTVLTLYDQDGASILNENDDIVVSVRTDSAISYTVTRSGRYYLGVRAWDYPSSGGDDFKYTINLSNDHQPPTAQFIAPVTGQGILVNRPYTLTVSAIDNESWISRVQFFWHSPDWQTGDWQRLGEDEDGSNGWQFVFNQSGISLQPGMAFYARVFDAAGNWTGASAWNLHPATSAVYLPAVSKRR